MGPVPGQEDQQEAFLLPLSSFSVENEASLREPPSLDVSLKLLNHFAADGFVSVGEPVLVRVEAGAGGIIWNELTGLRGTF